jgi:HEAT repeat protein
MALSPSLFGGADVFEAIGSVLRSRESTVTDKREAINALWGAQNAYALAALRAALAEPDRELQLHAAGALLAANDVMALPIATEALLQTGAPLPDDVALTLRGAISRGLTAEAAVPSLGRLLTAKDPATRRAAATALGHTKSPAALAHLARSLDDTDTDVRLAAVWALADLSGHHDYAPSGAAFRADEERFLRYWKHWIVRR